MGRAREWDVEIEFLLPNGDRLLRKHADRLLSAMERHEGTASASRHSIAIALAVDASGVPEAIALGIRRTRTMLRIAGIPHRAEVARAEGRTPESTEREINEPNLPELVGAAELAAALGVSRQRIAELRASGRLPVPIAELRAGPVWQKPAIDRFVEGWARTPGRPRAVSAR